METSRINEVRATQRSVGRRLQYRRVVVRHFKVARAAPAEDQQRRPGKHDGLAQEEEVRELHGRVLRGTTASRNCPHGGVTSWRRPRPNVEVRKTSETDAASAPSKSAKQNLRGHQPVSQLIFVLMVFESIIKPSTPSS